MITMIYCFNHPKISKFDTTHHIVTPKKYGKKSQAYKVKCCIKKTKNDLISFKLIKFFFFLYLHFSISNLKFFKPSFFQCFVLFCFHSTKKKSSKSIPKKQQQKKRKQQNSKKKNKQSKTKKNNIAFSVISLGHENLAGAKTISIKKKKMDNNTI